MSHRVDDERVVRLYLSGLSQQKVADCMGISLTTVRNAMERSGISARPLSEAHGDRPLVPLNAMEADVLDGLMLGDGCLTKSAKSKNATLSIKRTSRDLEYLTWSAEVFATRLAPEGVVVRDCFDARTGKTHSSARMRTVADPALTKAHSRWYPQGRKVVPTDLVLTPVTIAVWLADDGSVSHASRRSPDVKFATHGFTIPEVERLVAILSDRYGGEARLYGERGSSQRTIRIFGAPARRLLREVDPVFPPLSRKSDVWRKTELLCEKEAVPACPRCESERVYRWARTSKGVQQFKCQACMRVFRDEYERSWRNPRAREEAA